MNELGENDDHDEVVRRSFERQVPLFTGPTSPFAQRADTPGPLAWIEPLSPDAIVLDVACGAAHASESIAPSVRQVVGLDLTIALLRLGAERLRAAGIHNVVLQEGNAEVLPFVDESFDIVFCRSSLHHFADPKRAVAEMVRVCRIGGRVVLVDIVAPDQGRELLDHVHRLLDPSHVRSYTEVELADLLPAGTESERGGNRTSGRIPIDVIVTEQSERDGVLALLRAELSGDGARTGFDPADVDGQLLVSFTITTFDATRR